MLNIYTNGGDQELPNHTGSYAMYGTQTVTTKEGDGDCRVNMRSCVWSPISILRFEVMAASFHHYPHL